MAMVRPRSVLMIKADPAPRRAPPFTSELPQALLHGLIEILCRVRPYRGLRHVRPFIDQGICGKSLIYNYIDVSICQDIIVRTCQNIKTSCLVPWDRSVCSGRVLRSQSERLTRASNLWPAFYVTVATKLIENGDPHPHPILHTHPNSHPSPTRALPMKINKIIGSSSLSFWHNLYIPLFSYKLKMGDAFQSPLREN